MENAQEPRTVLTEGDEYALLSSADGGLLLLRSKTDKMTAHLLGEDAARFRADLHEVMAQHPDWRADQTLAQLWDQGGYGWLATDDGAHDGDAR
jgi:hypothetical protein